MHEPAMHNRHFGVPGFPEFYRLVSIPDRITFQNPLLCFLRRADGRDYQALVSGLRDTICALFLSTEHQPTAHLPVTAGDREFKNHFESTYPSRNSNLS